MGLPAARVTDMTACPMVTGIVPHVGGPIMPPCCPTVLTGSMPQARVSDMAICAAGGPANIITGAWNVLVGGQPAARITDMTSHGGVIVTGFPTVLIGMAGAGGGGGGGGGAPGGAAAAPAAGGAAAPGTAAGQQAAGGSATRTANDPGPIGSPAVQQGMREAWADSQADDPANRHEEGGYIVRNADGSLGVERWPRGAGASIAPPPRDAQGRYNGREVVGEFHTHPNPPVDENGRQWTQGGHDGDWNGIQAENYPGDSYIISDGHIYHVDPQGNPTRDADGNEVPMGTRTDLIGE